MEAVSSRSAIQHHAKVPLAIALRVHPHPRARAKASRFQRDPLPQQLAQQHFGNAAAIRLTHLASLRQTPSYPATEAAFRFQ